MSQRWRAGLHRRACSLLVEMSSSVFGCLWCRCAYLGGSAIQTVGDNPVTAYRQLVQQYAKGVNGEVLSPAEAGQEANKVRPLHTGFTTVMMLLAT